MQALLLVGVALFPFSVFGQGSAPEKKAVDDCHVGSYRLSEGTEVDIGNADDGKLRWRRKDGTTGALTRSPDGSWRSTLGWTDRADGVGVSFADCSKGTITLQASQVASSSSTSPKRASKARASRLPGA